MSSRWIARLWYDPATHQMGHGGGGRPLITRFTRAGQPTDSRSQVDSFFGVPFHGILVKVVLLVLYYPWVINNANLQ